MTNEIAVWDETPLGTLCKENGGSIQTGPFGSQLHAEDYKEQGVPIITVEHLGDGSILHRNLPLVGVDDYRRLSRYVLRTGDLVFSRVGAIDRCARVSEQEDGWLFSGRCLRVRLGSGSTDSKYMSFVLNSHEALQWILNHAVGSTMACLNTSILSNVPLRLASPPEQRKIARILTTLDNLIEKTEALIAKYQAIKQGMMHDLFTRGVDLGGQLRPTQEQAPDLYKQSELGWIPKEWSAKPMGNLVTDWAVGPRFSGELYAEDGNIATLRTTDMDDEGNLDLTTMPLARLNLASFRSHLLQANDLVISRSGANCGITATFSSHDVPVLPGAFLIRFRFNSDVDPEYLKRLFNSHFGRKSVRNQAEGGVLKNIRGTSILRVLVPLPPIGEQLRIILRLASCESVAVAENRHLKLLKAKKSGLTQDLLTGRVRVKVDETVEVAAHA